MHDHPGQPGTGQERDGPRQVEGILGAGTKDSSYTAAGEVTEGYTWCGDVSRDYLNSPVVEITFVDGKVDIVQPYNIPAN